MEKSLINLLQLTASYLLYVCCLLVLKDIDGIEKQTAQNESAFGSLPNPFRGLNGTLLLRFEIGRKSNRSFKQPKLKPKLKTTYSVCLVCTRFLYKTQF